MPRGGGGDDDEESSISLLLLDDNPNAVSRSKGAVQILETNDFFFGRLDGTTDRVRLVLDTEALAIKADATGTKQRRRRRVNEATATTRLMMEW